MYSFKTKQKSGFGWLSAPGMFIYHMMYQNGEIGSVRTSYLQSRKILDIGS